MAYPNTIDSFTTKVDGVDYPQASHVNLPQTAIVSIETELGTLPKGSFADVKTRLNNHPLNKLNATVAPTANDDSGDGYGVGSIWMNTTLAETYVCTNASIGAAIWDKISALWIDWTPTVTQSGSVTCNITTARYKILNGIIYVEMSLAITGTGTGNNAIQIGGQPAAIQKPSGTNFNVGAITDSGIGTYYGVVYVNGAIDWRFIDISALASNFIGITPNFALASGDKIEFRLFYMV